MANFAEVNEYNEVINIIVVADSVLMDQNDVEQESLGLNFLTSLFGDSRRFVQTSITGRIRKRFACIGMFYNPSIDAFIEPQPHPSWTLDEVAAIWVPPIPKPGEPYVYDHNWNEELLRWEKID